tara:strand:+ start:58181 stop:59017 length:837 start_codon:yes stop_codon:yes gene_type:complete
MKLKTNLVFLIFIFGLSCQKKSQNTTTGNPSISAALTSSSTVSTVYFRHNPKHLIELLIPKLFAFPAPTSLTDSAGNSVQLNKNWITIGELEFKTAENVESGEETGSNVDFKGPYTVNLFSEAPTILGSNQVGIKEIRRIKMKLIRTSTLPEGAPSGLLNKSLYVEGTVNGHGFSFSTFDESESQISGATAVTPLENKTLLVELKVANLIKKMNLSIITSNNAIDDTNRVPASNPCPTIDPSASDLFTCFRKGFETESTLGLDEDGNFKLDPGEQQVK